MIVTRFAPSPNGSLHLGHAFSAIVAPDLDTLLAPSLGHVHFTGVGIHGSGPNNELMDVHSSSNNTAPSDVRIFEAWYEQPIDAVTLRLGLLSADQEFWIVRHATTLIAAISTQPRRVGDCSTRCPAAYMRAPST